MTVNLEGGAQAENIVWVVAGGAGVEIGTDATFAGVVLAQTGINVLTNATVNGCLYAQTDVNLQMATVTGCDCDLVDLKVDSACADEDGEITVTNSNDTSVMVTVTGPNAYEETMEVPAGGSATWENLVDGTYSLETDNIAIGLDITTLDISCDSAIPDVVTTPATETDGSIATLNGELIDLGDFDTVDVFFEWRELGEEEFMTTPTQTLDAPGDFNAEIVGLEPGKTYEFRAVVLANGTRDEGAILNFTKIPKPDLVYWQVDFGEGKNVPIPPAYWPDDGFAALGTNEGVEQNPSFARTQTPGQLGDVTIQDFAFQFDDNDEPTEVSITFTVDEGGESRFLHLAVFTLPEPYEQDEIDQQQLFEETSGEFSGGDTGTLTLSLPTA